MQKCAVISRDLNVHAHKLIQHVFFRARDLPATHTYFCKERHGLYSTSLSLFRQCWALRETARGRKTCHARGSLLCHEGNRWNLPQTTGLFILPKKNHRHKQQHWLCSPIKRLCFYIHSGILTKMWRCPCAILQAEIRLCVTNARWARHGNPQTELVRTPPRYRLLSASPSSRSQSVELTIPSWTCASGWFRQKEFENLKTLACGYVWRRQNRQGSRSKKSNDKIFTSGVFQNPSYCVLVSFWFIYRLLTVHSGFSMIFCCLDIVGFLPSI